MVVFGQNENWNFEIFGTVYRWIRAFRYGLNDCYGIITHCWMKNYKFSLILWKISENLKIGASKLTLFGRKCLENGTFWRFAKNRWEFHVCLIAQTVRFDEAFNVVQGPTGAKLHILGSKWPKTIKNSPFWALFGQIWPFLTVSFWPFLDHCAMERLFRTHCKIHSQYTYAF